MLLFLYLLGTFSPEMMTPIEWQGDLGKVRSLAVSPDGRIFFVVPTEGIIYQTDLSGKARPSIGKKGQGPNEFNWVDAIYYDEPWLYAYDGAKEKMFRIDPKTGQFVKSWRFGNINVFDIQGERLMASLMIPRSGHMFAIGHIGEELSFDRFIGGLPCCLTVSGAKRAAVLAMRDGSFWAAHTGEFELKHFRKDGSLIKTVRTELPGYVPPDNEVRHSRFDVQGRSLNVMRFDKIQSLYSLNGLIVLYRFKVISNSYLDIFTKDGDRVAFYKSDHISPVGVYNDHLYGFLGGHEDSDWDAMLVKFEFIP